MKDRERHAPISQPTEERTADQSTQSASGLSAERPGEVAPRKYDEDQNTPDPVMPDDDSSLNTKI